MGKRHKNKFQKAIYHLLHPFEWYLDKKYYSIYDEDDECVHKEDSEYDWLTRALLWYKDNLSSEYDHQHSFKWREWDIYAENAGCAIRTLFPSILVQRDVMDKTLTIEIHIGFWFIQAIKKNRNNSKKKLHTDEQD